MKKFFVMAVLSMVAMMSAASAEAKVEAPLWNCAMTFDVKGGGVQFFVGYFKLAGKGQLTCVDVAGNVEKHDLKVTMGGKPLALNVAVAPKLHIRGVATGIGLATSPMDLEGKYLAANANAAVLGGAGATLSLRGTKNMVSMNVSLALVTGLGFNAGINKIKIEIL